MSKLQKTVMIGFALGCICLWATALWLLAQKMQLEMELDTFVCLAAQSTASEAAKSGAPYFLFATNASGSIATIVATNNGIPVRLHPSFSPRDALYVQMFNERTSKMLGR